MWMRGEGGGLDSKSKGVSQFWQGLHKVKHLFKWGSVFKIRNGSCNTLGVCHQLSNGFELKHGMLSGDEGVKIKSTRVSSNLNLGNTPLLAYWPFLDIYLSNVEGAYFMCLTSISTYMNDWKSFMKLGIKKSHEMISISLFELHY